MSKLPEDMTITFVPGGEPLTGRELEEQSARFVHSLRLMGVTPGNGAIVWLLENRVEILVIAGAQRAGFDILPLNTHCTPAEVVDLIATLKPSVLVTSDRQLARRGMRAALQGIDPSIARILIGEPVTDWYPYTSAIGARFGSWEGIEAAQPGKMLLLSGGTTGTPKVVVHRKEQHEAANDLMPDAGDTLLLAQPIYHTGPFTFLMKALKSGANIVIMKKWDTSLALKAIERYRVTHMFIVPTQMARMLNLPREERSEADISSLQLVIHGAEVCPDGVKWRWLEWMPEGCVTIEAYGMSEDFGTTVITDAEWRLKPGSVGRPMGCRIVIRDEQGNEVPRGRIGIVWFVRDDPGHRMDYLGSPKETATSYRETEGGVEGTAGDLGLLDEDGFLFLKGRIKDMVICGGANVYPARTAAVLRDHTAVADAAVVGVPHEDWGEALSAVVELNSGYEASEALVDELIRICRDTLGGFQAPQSITFAVLPRLDTGKLRMKDVRALIPA